MLAWIVLLPLLGAAVNGLVFASGLWRKALGGSEHTEHKLSGWLGSGVILASAIVSTIMLVKLNSVESGSAFFTQDLFVWIPSGTLEIKFELLFDSITALMAMIVTWVSFLIHVYSTGYMHDDKSYSRYFSYLNLFVFFMLVLILGNNFLLMFVGWEGVGLASYLLIGFWYTDPIKATAGRKAFILNRIGDVGFILGIFLIFYVFGSLNYQEVFSLATNPNFLSTVSAGVITAIALLLFIGAVGKSAQIPLHVWLPDAMAGPTPVSALIHAATMVTAGVYMVTRCSAFFSASPDAQMVVVSIAAATALFAATIAITQNDIKKVLAYSTVSQLGYMFMGVGSGAYAAGMFHLMTHAFFKALLFLGAGSVIHALFDEQDITKMGGLRKDLPLTSLTFFVGTLAIAGVPLLSGFFSKDEILTSLYMRGYTIHWAVGLFTALLTAFYMMRLYLLVFEGKSRIPSEIKKKIHESPFSMTFPLLILAVLSIFAGYIGFPDFIGRAIFIEHSNIIESFLKPAITWPAALLDAHHGFGHWTLVLFSILAAFGGIFLAFFIYVFKKGTADKIAQFPLMRPLYTATNRRWFVDEIYDFLIVKPYKAISESSFEVDRNVIDGLVNGAGSVVRGLATILKPSQSGLLRFYACIMALGTLAIVAYMLMTTL